jgi:flagellar basal body rod protein FlgG
MYSAATALNVGEKNQELVAFNLAHSQVPGFRRQGLVTGSFTDALEKLVPDRPVPEQDLFGAAPARGYTSFVSGPLQVTGNPLDLAIGGEGFFEVQGPDGPLYTRSGTFTLNAAGQLQTQDGRQVNGVGGAPITLPADAAQIVVSPDGTVLANGEPVGRLQVAHFNDPTVLVQIGTTLFQAPPGVRPDTGTTADTVLQGTREGSNVQEVDELVAMIAGMRYFQSAERVLRAMSEALQLNTRPQGG